MLWLAVQRYSQESLPPQVEDEEGRRELPTREEATWPEAHIRHCREEEEEVSLEAEREIKKEG